MTGAAIGALIGIGFGGVWAVAGTLGLPRGWRVPAATLAVLVTAALIAAPGVTHLWPSRGGIFRGAVYAIWVTLEAIAIVIAASVLNRRGQQDLLLPVIGIIVGIHFLGLWQATATPRFVWIATAVTAVCAASLLLPGRNAQGTSPRQIAAGIGTGLVLWIAGAWTFLNG